MEYKLGKRKNWPHRKSEQKTVQKNKLRLHVNVCHPRMQEHIISPFDSRNFIVAPIVAPIVARHLKKLIFVKITESRR